MDSNLKELIEDLKGHILSGCLDIALIEYQKENYERELKAILRAKNALPKLFESLDQDDDSPSIELVKALKEAIRCSEIAEKSIQKHKPRPSSAGKKKTYFAVSIEILKAIDVCEVNKLDLKWLKDYLKPNGEVYTDIKEVYPIKTDIMLPVPSTADNKIWISRLKETLQRSLFSEDLKVTKKTNGDFIKKREQFYSDMRESFKDELYDYKNIKR